MANALPPCTFVSLEYVIASYLQGNFCTNFLAWTAGIARDKMRGMLLL